MIENKYNEIKWLEKNEKSKWHLMQLDQNNCICSHETN